MTDRRDPRAHNRLRRQLKDFIGRWGDLIMVALGTLTVIVAIGLFLVALSLRSSSIADKKASELARKQAHVQCVRTKTIGPYSVKDAERRNVYPPKVLAIAKGSIPKSCP